MIAYVLSQFPALSETFIVEELLDLKRRGVDLIVLSLKYPKTVESFSSNANALMPFVYYSKFLFSREILKANMQLIRCNSSLYIDLLRGLFIALFFQPVELFKTLTVFPKVVYYANIARQKGCIRVHAHFCNVPAAAARIISRILKVPFSFTAHGSDIYRYPPVDLLTRIQDASPCITVSEYNRRYLAGLSPTIDKNMIEVIHCGINLDNFNYSPRQLVAGRTLRILTVARLEHVKGLDVLIETCAFLRDTGLDFTCSLIGDGSKRAALEKQVNILNL